jgi:heat shock protein HslJ
MMRKLAWGAALVMALAGCGSAAEGSGTAGPGPTGGVTPQGRTFLSTAVTEHGKPRPLVGSGRIELVFDGDQLRAHASCNYLSGTVLLAGGRLDVTDLASTEMGCDPDRHAQDEWLTAFLSARPTWRLDGATLVLRAADTEIRLTDRRIVQPDRALLGTRWVVDTVLDGKTAGSVPRSTEAHLVFRDGDRVEGSTGCNTFSGTATRQGDTVRFSRIAVTRIGCSGDVGRLEAAVLAVLDGPATLRIEADRLTLTRPDGRGLQLRAGS